MRLVCLAGTSARLLQKQKAAPRPGLPIRGDASPRGDHLHGNSRAAHLSRGFGKSGSHCKDSRVELGTWESTTYCDHRLPALQDSSSSPSRHESRSMTPATPSFQGVATPEGLYAHRTVFHSNGGRRLTSGEQFATSQGRWWLEERLRAAVSRQPMCDSCVSQEPVPDSYKNKRQPRDRGCLSAGTHPCGGTTCIVMRGRRNVKGLRKFWSAPSEFLTDATRTRVAPVLSSSRSRTPDAVGKASGSRDPARLARGRPTGGL